MAGSLHAILVLERQYWSWKDRAVKSRQRLCLPCYLPGAEWNKVPSGVLLRLGEWKLAGRCVELK